MSRFRPLRERLHTALEVESFGRYEALVYSSIFAGAVYAVLGGKPPPQITDNMGPVVYQVFVWTQLLAVPVAMAAYLIHDKYTGFWMQLAGHSALASVLMTFEAAILAGVKDSGTWAFFPLGGLMLAIWGLALRDVLRIVEARAMSDATETPDGR